MDAEVLCTICHEEHPYEGFKVRLTTKRWATTQCPRGHKWAIIFQAPGWGRLFERGLDCLALDAPRDAVLDAYTAFEMYLAEVPVRARYDREPGATPRKLRQVMRAATRLTENAIGAARATFSVLSGKPAPTWSPDKTTNVRNEAIHAGQYPTAKAAEILCVELVRVIVEFEEVLTAQGCVNEVPFHRAVWMEDADDLKKEAPEYPIMWSSGGVYLDPTMEPFPRSTPFAEHLEAVRAAAARRR
jgi:hypothetical protein